MAASPTATATTTADHPGNQMFTTTPASGPATSPAASAPHGPSLRHHPVTARHLPPCPVDQCRGHRACSASTIPTLRPVLPQLTAARVGGPGSQLDAA